MIKRLLLSFVVIFLPTLLLAQTQTDRLAGRGLSTFDALANTQTLTMVGATPSVAGGNVFQTNNATLTTVTNFLNGRDSQRIIIVCGDVFTVIQNNASIVTSNGNAIVCTGTNQTTEFVYVGSATAWVQISGGSGGGGSSNSLRLQLAGGTPLTTADFAPLSGSCWGSGAQISNIVGVDSAFTISILAGVSPCMEPNFTLTFHDGPWAVIYAISGTVQSGPIADITSTNNLASTTLTYEGLPITGTTYTISASVIGASSIINPTPHINPIITNPAANQVISGSSFNLTLQGPLNASGGINSFTDARGLQVFNAAPAAGTCPTAATAGTTCTTGAITLPVAEPDTNYIAVCTGLSPTNVPTIVTVAKSNASFTITIAALSAAAANYASYDCTVSHN